MIGDGLANLKMLREKKGELGLLELKILVNSLMEFMLHEHDLLTAAQDRLLILEEYHISDTESRINLLQLRIGELETIVVGLAQQNEYLAKNVGLIK